ncbi:MAG TPA: hypothetical protein VFS75_02845, partial [Candidatus Paceibacterota bacterium]|nr:hypothetical protein [Candidatus Paceibacterota bacterium]
MRFLYRLLDHIYAQSPETKSRYAFAGAAVITGVIAIIWVSTIPSRFATTAEIAPETNTTAKDFVDAWQKTTDQMGTAISSLGTAAGQEDPAAARNDEPDVTAASEPIPGALGSLTSDESASTSVSEGERSDDPHSVI